MLSYKKIGQFRISRNARFPDIPLHGRDLRRQRLVDGSMNGGIRREGSCLLPFRVFVSRSALPAFGFRAADRSGPCAQLLDLVLERLDALLEPQHDGQAVHVVEREFLA